jgi:hypothetical protein
VTGFGVKTLEALPIEPVLEVRPNNPAVEPAVPGSRAFATLTPLCIVTLLADNPAVLGEPLLVMEAFGGETGVA